MYPNCPAATRRSASDGVQTVHRRRARIACASRSPIITRLLPADNRKQEKRRDPIRARSFHTIYDSLNRIKDATESIAGSGQSWKQTFSYDRFGNRRFDTETDVNGATRTTTLAPECQVAVCNPQIDPATNKLIGYSFDNAGNTRLDADNRQFIYDSENKQVEVKDQNGATVGKYFYNGNGQRVKTISATETAVFVYNTGGKLVAEYSTQIAQVQEAKVSYLTNDHLGSPRITADADGQVISRRDFQPFGEEIARAGYGSDTVRQRFTSYDRDTETELDFAEARMYNK